MSASAALQEHDDGLVPASCWCQDGYVRVTPAEVLAGQTRPCRRRYCRQLDAAGRAS